MMLATRRNAIARMSRSTNREVPTLQRVYDNIWLLALAAIIFFALSYVAWGMIDIFAAPPR